MTNSDNLLHLVSTGQHLVFEKHLPFGIFPPSALFFLSSVQSSPMAASRPNQATPMMGPTQILAIWPNVIIVNKKNPKYKI